MKTEKEKMIAGEPYVAGDAQLTKERLKCKQLLYELNIKHHVLSEESREVLKLLIPHAPASLYIEPPFFCDYGYNIFCGENVYFNVNCVVLDGMPVKIGNHVFCGPGVQIYTASHPMDAELRKQVEFSKPVVIGDDCWIGGGSIILPGITIGNRCVIGAGSVVTKDVPDDTFVAGNPARKIRDMEREG